MKKQILLLLLSSIAMASWGQGRKHLIDSMRRVNENEIAQWEKSTTFWIDEALGKSKRADSLQKIVDVLRGVVSMAADENAQLRNPDWRTGNEPGSFYTRGGKEIFPKDFKRIYDSLEDQNDRLIIWNQDWVKVADSLKNIIFWNRISINQNERWADQTCNALIANFKEYCQQRDEIDSLKKALAAFNHFYYGDVWPKGATFRPGNGITDDTLHIDTISREPLNLNVWKRSGDYYQTVPVIQVDTNQLLKWKKDYWAQFPDSIPVFVTERNYWSGFPFDLAGENYDRVVTRGTVDLRKALMSVDSSAWNTSGQRLVDTTSFRPRVELGYEDFNDHSIWPSIQPAEVDNSLYRIIDRQLYRVKTCQEYKDFKEDFPLFKISRETDKQFDRCRVSKKQRHASKRH